ncbi:putative protein of unknown function (DUF2423) [Lyophyllum shimeji]|uniref:DUF2423 domain-containing protein n=1 Tax=Lyophyllum shimeji TaxID=47721 RepID=A0A9P3PDF1_LYOSH|nr:putative protein of unknown function (DUF2423) [Lyophyllum shimeji]
MAKSIRSKAKRTFRSKKRESGVYAATEAARLHRLNAKLASVASADKEGDVPIQDLEGEANGMPDQQDDALNDSTETMAVDAEPPKRISTHGPKGSRREEWRKSKGMVPKPKLGALNRQGVPAARRKAGRSKRRR